MEPSYSSFFFSLSFSFFSPSIISSTINCQSERARIFRSEVLLNIGTRSDIASYDTGASKVILVDGPRVDSDETGATRGKSRDRSP